MKILVIENDELVIHNLQSYILKVNPSAGIFIVKNQDDALSLLQQQPRFHLIFSRFNSLSGLGWPVFNSLLIKCPVIFMSNFSPDIAKLCKSYSIDILSNPLKQKDVQNVLSKYKFLGTSLTGTQNTLKLRRFIDRLEVDQKQIKDNFLFKEYDNLVSVDSSEVAYFISDKQNSFLINKNGRKYSLKFTVEELMGVVDEREFFRICMNIIVCRDAVCKIIIQKSGRLRLIVQPAFPKEISLFVNRGKEEEFKRWINFEKQLVQKEEALIKQ